MLSISNVRRWDPNSTAGAGVLHALNPVRVKYIATTVRQKLESVSGHSESSLPLSGAMVADIGCGGGLLSESLARLGGQVTAIDPTEKAINVAKQHASVDPVTASINYRLATVSDLVEEGAQFDLVCSLEVVEHTPAPSDFIENCAKLVKPGGALVMSTLNRTLKSYAMAIAGAEMITRIVPIGTHHWDKFVTPEEMRRSMEMGGLHVQDTSGIVLNPLAMRPITSSSAWKIHPTDIDVNYIMYATRPLTAS